MVTATRPWGRYVVGILVGALLAGVASSAALAGSGKPKRTVTVLSAKKVKGRVSVSVRVAFTPAAGTSKSKACAGTVTLTTIVKHGRRSASLHGKPALSAGLCAAVLRGRLPLADYGKSVPFKLRFRGSHGAFAKSLHVRVAPPHVAPGTPTPTTPGGTAPTTPVPATPTTPTTPNPLPALGAPTAANGTWQGHLDGPYYTNISMTVVDGVITAARLLSPVQFLKCTQNGTTTEVTRQTDWAFPLPTSIGISPQGEFSAEKSVQRPPTTPGGNSDDFKYTLSGVFYTEQSPRTGTFTIGKAGSLVDTGIGYGCSGTATGVLTKP